MNSPVMPTDVAIPAGFGGNPIAFFDDYSWRAFLAIVWPAQTGMRGQADATKALDDAGPRVFETYKPIWEVFHPNGSAPAPWNTYDDKTFNPCGNAPAFGDVQLASFSKFSDIGQAGQGGLVGPIVAQNQTYVRYLTGFNQTEFEQIDSNAWYLRSNLAGPVTFPDGSIDIKSAWVDMAGIANPERYYTRMANVMNPADGSCSERLVGLIGLHIVQKTPTRPQWIWSTFEQVDNVPPPSGSNQFGLNDGSGTPMPDSNPFPIDPPVIPVPRPFNIERLKPIHNSTQTTNQLYQAAIRAQNPQSKWQFYRLVMTQWPITPSNPALPGTPNNTFPGFGSDQTAFANVALETFEQTSVRTGCMNCHNIVGRSRDFLWTLQDHAYPPNVPAMILGSQARKNLRALLKGTKSDIQRFRANHP